MSKHERFDGESSRLWEDNPQVFFADFRQSEDYRSAYDNYFQGKTPVGNVTKGEKREVFEYSADAVSALVHFAQIDSGFSYNPVYYSPETQEAVEVYSSHVEKIRKGLASEDSESLDIERSIYHARVARLLAAEGIAPNEKLGRVVGRFILVERGLDTYDALLADSTKQRAL